MGDAGTNRPTRPERDAGRPWLRALAIVALVAVLIYDGETGDGIGDVPLLVYVLIAASPAGIHADDIVDRAGKAIAKYLKG